MRFQLQPIIMKIPPAAMPTTADREMAIGSAIAISTAGAQPRTFFPRGEKCP